MKKISVWSIGIVAILFSLVTVASAVDMGDIVGTWLVYSKATGRVSRLGSDLSEGYGAITFNNDGSFSYTDHQGYVFTGDFNLSLDGKVITIQLDNHGYQEFEIMMEDWLYVSAAGDGIILENINFVHDTNGIVIKPVRTSNRTNGPTRATVTAKGIVYADVYDAYHNFLGYGAARFSFRSNIKVLFKQ